MWIQWCAFRWKLIALTICISFQPGASRHVYPYGHVPIYYEDSKPISIRNNVPLDEFSGHDERLPMHMRQNMQEHAHAHAFRTEQSDHVSPKLEEEETPLKNGSRQFLPGIQQAAAVAQQIQQAQAMAAIVAAQSQAQITQHTSQAAIQAAQAQAAVQQAYLQLAGAQQAQAAQLAAAQQPRPVEAAPQGFGALISSLAGSIGMSGILPLLGLGIGAAIFVLIAGFLITQLTVSEVRRSRIVNRYEQDEDTLQSIYAIAQRYRPCNTIRDSVATFRGGGIGGTRRRTRCRHLHGGKDHSIFSHEHDDDFGILSLFGLGDGGYGFGGKRRKHKFDGYGGGGYGGDLYDHDFGLGLGDGDNLFGHRAELIPSHSLDIPDTSTTWYEDILLGLGTLLLEPFGLN